MTDMNRRELFHTVAGAATAGMLANLTAAGQETKRQGSFTDVPGIRVGHFTEKRRPTGCTVILFEQEASVGVDYDGSAPGDFLGVMLQPASPINTVHGILLAGAGPFGLPAVQGVTRYLEEKKAGFDWGIPNLRIPIVVGAVIDDLALGDAGIRPGPEEAYKACQTASSVPVEEGNVGIGAGATVGKMLIGQGIGGMKAGVGCAGRRFGEVIISAMVVANAVGDIRDWRTAKILAGGRRADGKGFVDIAERLGRNLAEKRAAVSSWLHDPAFRSTTLALVATNVDFNKTELTKMAMMASTGAARAINPYHTTGDGDSTFAISTNRLKQRVPVSVVGALAAELVSEALKRSVLTATSIENWPAYRDYTAKLGT